MATNRKHAAFFVIGLSLWLCNPSFGQEESKFRQNQEKVDEELLAKELGRRNEGLVTQQAIAGVIDPETYFVGPGDALKLNFWGPTSEDLGLTLTVTPEGKLIIPTVGVVDANYKKLQELQAEVKRACAEKYDSRRVQVSLHLTKLRLQRVYIVGQVKTPGVFAATAIDRISFYVSEAEGFTEWADEAHVQLRHQDGTVDTLDMTRFYDYGELAQDAYVRGGDIIYVPRIVLTEQTVFVEGDLLKHGPHKITPNENLLDFLYRIRALKRTANLDAIQLVRGQQSLHVNILSHGAGNGIAHMPLQNGDHIIVPPIKAFVYVQGAVRNPGNFPFIVGYKAGDYAGLAGGVIESADFKGVKVIRHQTGKSEKGPNQEVLRGDTVVVPASRRTTIGQYLTFTAQAATIVLAFIAAKNTVDGSNSSSK